MNSAGLHRACPVCACSRSRPHWQKGELFLVRCSDCRMIYTNPIPAEMAGGQFYDAAGKDYYLSPAKLESDYADIRFERELRLFRHHCPRGSVLDVGCSTGAFLFQLKKRWPRDYEILGTDVSGPPLDYAETRGVSVVRGDLLELEFTQPTGAPASGPAGPEKAEHRAGSEIGAPFDAIMFWAVVEHLAEPKRFLEKAHTLLKPGGLCFVLVPNFKSLAVRLLGARYRYVYEQHLNYFTARTLTALVGPSFQVMETRFTHFNPLVLWQDWWSGGRAVSNVERGELLRRTTSYKQKAWMKPVKILYGLAEKSLATFGLADNVVVVLKKPQ